MRDTGTFTKVGGFTASQVRRGLYPGLLTLVLCCQQATSGRDLAIPQPQPALTILMSFDRPFSSSSIGEMEHEFERLMPAPVRIEWRMLGEVNRGETFERVVVSRFEGTCEVQGTTESPRPGRLAITRMWRNQVLPFPEVDCDAIGAMLEARSATTNPLRLRLLFGRAMGRVLAHEVYHIELNTPLHSSKGIAKPAFAASDLFTAHFGFAPREMKQMTDLLATSSSKH